ncbi:MAG: carboxypeptidase regulatory-like domain-containing protein [Spirochaetes bacterium]|nr:carboxypeptidase regulatory-like domain-containing protein [Spirochaetota bacterium]
MKRTVHYFLFAVAAAVCGTMISCYPSLANPFGLSASERYGKSNVAYFAGTVFDAYSGDTIAGADLILGTTSWLSSSVRYSTTSDANGRYSFGTIRDYMLFSDKYVQCVSVSKAGYAPSGITPYSSGITNFFYVDLFTNGKTNSYNAYLARIQSATVILFNNVYASNYPVYDIAASGGIFWLTIRPTAAEPCLIRCGGGLTSAATISSNLFTGTYYDRLATASCGSDIVLAYADSWGSSSVIRYFNSTTGAYLSNRTVPYVITALDYEGGYFWAVVTNNIMQFSPSWELLAVLHSNHGTLKGVCKTGNYIYCPAENATYYSNTYCILQYNWTYRTLSGKADVGGFTSISGIITNGSGGFYIADNLPSSSRIFNVTLQ